MAATTERGAPDRRDAWGALLRPRTVAVVGASERSFYGRNVVERLGRSAIDRLVLVNPAREVVFDQPCVATLREVDVPVDLVVLAVRAELAVEQVALCVELGVPACIVLGNGFSELADPVGRQRQEALRQVAHDAGMVLIGPSSLGVINAVDDVHAFAGGQYSPVMPGGIGLASQSGGLLQASLAEGYERALGFSYAISAGGEAAVTVLDAWEVMLEGGETDVVCLVLEQVSDDRRFVDLGQRSLEREKPVFVLKLGRSDGAQRMAQSHTGAITGVDRFYDSLFAQVGAQRVESIEAMFDAASWLGCVPRRQWRPVRGVGVVSLSGGAAGLAADCGGSVGIEVPPLSEVAPGPGDDDGGGGVGDVAAVTNPLELGRQLQRDQPERWAQVVTTMADDAAIDALLLMETDVLPERIRDLVRLRDATGKPVAWSRVTRSMSRFGEAGLSMLREAGIAGPVGPAAAMAGAHALNIYLEHAARRREVWDWSGTTAVVDAAAAVVRRHGSPVLVEHETRPVLERLSIAGPPQRDVTTVEEAVAAASAVGYPVVVKASAGNLLHRTELGLVEVGLAGPDAVRAAATRMLAYVHEELGDPDGRLLVQGMVSGPLELLVGVDNAVGGLPLVVLGQGGKLAELSHERLFAVAPVSPRYVEEQIASSSLGPIFSGYRGDPPLDMASVVDVVAKVSALAYQAREEIDSIEINPLLVREKGAGSVALDGLIVKKAVPGAAPPPDRPSDPPPARPSDRPGGRSGAGPVTR